MTFTQKMKVFELKPFMESIFAIQGSSAELIKVLQELKLEVDLPGIDAKELNLSFSKNTLTLSRKGDIEEKSTRTEPGNIVAKSANTKVALGLADSMARTADPVVIYGENGTGKTLFARTIHQKGPRSKQPFVCFPCGVVEIDGVEQQIIDLLAELGSGTLYFDEIQDLDVDTQEVLYEIIHNPVSQKTFRVITATSVDLDSLVQKGEFSADLWTLLQGCYIELLPLRERKDEIEVLVTFYLKQLCQRRGLEPKKISPEVMNILEAYRWPGNVRELVNTLEQLLSMAQEKKTLFAKDLPAHIRIQTIESSAAQKKGL
ncbi:MAG: sigma 54-interacting transcriptional regulator [Thermodesulfobacteriota bacterium]|nr:sigma 54-interacting transcriptional regulator [Thermodesulfobacteriota bacterium]